MTINFHVLPVENILHQHHRQTMAVTDNDWMSVGQQQIKSTTNGNILRQNVVFNLPFYVAQTDTIYSGSFVCEEKY